ncbi:MAG: hypothetical protein HY783_07680 [Chloroflexi bacterium]|nr:hypothetical protein [Chloroflexota bacterium]
MEEGKPTFQGNQEEQKIASQVYTLLLAQGRGFALDAPIKQSLRNLVEFFLPQRPGEDPARLAEQIDQALQRNQQAFYRQEAEGEVYFYTSRRGYYVKPVTPPAIRRIFQEKAPAPPAAVPSVSKPTFKPTLLRREARSAAMPEMKPVRRELKRKARPVAAKAKPVVSLPDGRLLDLAMTSEQIFDEYHSVLQQMFQERLVLDGRFISFGDQWFLDALLVKITKGELRQIKEFIEDAGDAELDLVLLRDIFDKKPEDEDYEAFRFSLNYQLAQEKREFEFRGVFSERLWGVIGVPPARATRGGRRPAEVGQDLRYLEDETAAGPVGDDTWNHILSFYEIENGLLPLEAQAKRLVPPPLLKEQKSARLYFRVPQLGLSNVGELHYPAGNRGGWIDGLEELLDNLVAGALLVIGKGDAENVFDISIRPVEPQELDLLTYDEKRSRFVFAKTIVAVETVEGMALEKARFKGLANARRLDENSRRKSDSVVGWAFEKVGVKDTGENEVRLTASIDGLLPVVNIEKPFSRESLIRFLATHPHYQKLEGEADTYVYAKKLSGEPEGG